MEDGYPLDIGMAGNPRHVLQLVHHDRVGHIGFRSGFPGDIIGKKRTEVGSMLPHRTMTDIVYHRLVHFVNARFDGLDEPAPPDDRIDVGERHAGLLHGIENDLFTEVELVEHTRERSKLFGRVTEREFTHGLVVLIYRNLGRGRTRIYR